MAANPIASLCSLWAPRPSTAKASLGRRFERIGRAYVRRAGLRIVRVNWRVPMGEIDILAEGPRGLVIVEVRGRRKTTWSPIRSVSSAKLHRLDRMASWLAGRKRCSVGVVLLEIVGSPPALPAWLLARWPEWFGLRVRDYTLG